MKVFEDFIFVRDFFFAGDVGKSVLHKFQFDEDLNQFVSGFSKFNVKDFNTLEEKRRILNEIVNRKIDEILK